MQTELDLIGIFVFGISGALMAIRRDFDVIGIAMLASLRSFARSLNPPPETAEGCTGRCKRRSPPPRTSAPFEAYDEIINDTSLEGSSFFRYQRDELARQLSRDAALARLPDSLADVARQRPMSRRPSPIVPPDRSRGKRLD